MLPSWRSSPACCFQIHRLNLTHAVYDDPEREELVKSMLFDSPTPEDVIGGLNTVLAIERKMTELFRCDRGRTALRNEASDATDLRTRGTQLLLDALVAAIDVVHTVDDGFAISYQCRQHE
jgi:hypothetical protein